jgi:hypothetical protein
MPNNNSMADIDVDLDPQAVQRARIFINEFAVALIMQAKTLAFSRRTDLVLTKHIDEALELLNKKGQQSWTRDFAIIIGSAFSGAFLQGFVSALSSGNAFLMASYTFMGFVGLFIVFWGLRR